MIERFCRDVIHQIYTADSDLRIRRSRRSIKVLVDTYDRRRARDVAECLCHVLDREHMDFRRPAEFVIETKHALINIKVQAGMSPGAYYDLSMEYGYPGMDRPMTASEVRDAERRIHLHTRRNGKTNMAYEAFKREYQCDFGVDDTARARMSSITRNTMEQLMKTNPLLADLQFKPKHFTGLAAKVKHTEEHHMAAPTKQPVVIQEVTPKFIPGQKVKFGVEGSLSGMHVTTTARGQIRTLKLKFDECCKQYIEYEVVQFDQNGSGIGSCWVGEHDLSADKSK